MPTIWNAAAREHADRRAAGERIQALTRSELSPPRRIWVWITWATVGMIVLIAVIHLLPNGWLRDDKGHPHPAPEWLRFTTFAICFVAACVSVFLSRPVWRRLANAGPKERPRRSAIDGLTRAQRRSAMAQARGVRPYAAADATLIADVAQSIVEAPASFAFAPMLVLPAIVLSSSAGFGALAVFAVCMAITLVVMLLEARDKLQARRFLRDHPALEAVVS